MSEISKIGRITAVDKGHISVEITSCSACSSCAVRSSCGLSETKSKIIIIPTDDSQQYKQNDEVEILFNSEQGLQATFFAFGLPLLLLISVSIGFYLSGFGDIISSIFGIIILIPYYFALFFFREKLERKFTCKIKKTIVQRIKNL